MPPVHRFHRGMLTVPVDLLDGITRAFALDVREGSEFGLYPEEEEDLHRLVDVPRMGRTERDADAAVLSRARNTLDAYTLSAQCEGDLADDHTAPIGSGCAHCVWCQTLTLRDWCDRLLDLAGFTNRSPWIEPPTDDYDPAEVWRGFMTSSG